MYISSSDIVNRPPLNSSAFIPNKPVKKDSGSCSEAEAG
jgi:hypothetical protein